MVYHSDSHMTRKIKYSVSTVQDEHSAFFTTMMPTQLCARVLNLLTRGKTRSGTHHFTGFSGFNVVRSLVFSILFCASFVVLFLLAFVLLALRLKASHYPWISSKFSQGEGRGGPCHFLLRYLQQAVLSNYVL